MNKQHSSANRSVLASSGITRELPELATRLLGSQVSVIKEMMYLGAKEQELGKDIVSLGVGLPFYPAPSFVHKRVHDKLDSKADIDKYTLLIGLPELRSLVAKKASTQLGFPVSVDEILITPGSMAGLFYSMLTLVNPGDEVILPSPYFSSHAEQISLSQGKVVPVAMIEDKLLGYRLDLAKIEKAISRKTKAIVINSPHNPTGALFPKRDLMELAEIIRSRKIYLITDEVYDYLVYDNAEYFNMASIKSLWPRVIRCCSFSKKYGMMGWRIGYLHTNRELLLHMLKIHDANIVCAPHISQEAAIAALTGPQDIVKHHVEWLNQNRQIIMKRLNSLPELFSFVAPRGAYYVFPKFHLPLTSIEMAKKLLYEAGVVSVPGIGFGAVGEKHLRMSFGSAKEEITEAFDRIDNWYKKM